MRTNWRAAGHAAPEANPRRSEVDTHRNRLGSIAAANRVGPERPSPPASAPEPCWDHDASKKRCSRTPERAARPRFAVAMRGAYRCLHVGPNDVALLAQLVEQLTLNQRVEGSSPSGGIFSLRGFGRQRHERTTQRIGPRFRCDTWRGLRDAARPAGRSKSEAQDYRRVRFRRHSSRPGFCHGRGRSVSGFPGARPRVLTGMFGEGSGMTRLLDAGFLESDSEVFLSPGGALTDFQLAAQGGTR